MVTDRGRDHTRKDIMRTAIVGTGSYVPPKVITNFDLEQMLDTSDEWIRRRVGIRERHVADDSTATSDLGVIAAQRALDAAGMGPEDVDLVLCSTVSPDMPFPSTACIISRELGIVSHVPALDLGAACAGFSYAVHVADGLIRAGSHRTVLAIASETLTRFVDWTDRATCVLFGDGAGAAVLQAGDGESGIVYTRIGAESMYADPNLLSIPAGGSRKPPTEDTVRNREHTIHMEGRKLFKIAVSTMPEIALMVLDDAGFRVEDIDVFILHQMNVRIMETFAERLGISIDKLLINVDRYGNTSSASTILAFDEGIRGGRVKKGDRVFFLTFGAGWAWGAAVVEV